MGLWETLAGGAIGAVGSVINNERNLAYQREAQDYTKWLNNVTWQREDNAVQRRVADLKAAGLSPVLAAGSSAQAGSPVKIDPQNVGENVGESFISGATKAAQTQQSIAAAEAAKAQVDLIKTQTLVANQSVNNMKQKQLLDKAETALKLKDMEYYKGGRWPRMNAPWYQDLYKFLKSDDAKQIMKELKNAFITPVEREYSKEKYKGADIKLGR